MHFSTRLVLVLTMALLSASVAWGQFKATPNPSSEKNEIDKSTYFQFDPAQPATVRKVNKTLLTGMLRGIGPDGVEFTLNTGAAFTYPLNSVQFVRLVDGSWSFTPKSGDLEAAVTAARTRFPEAKPAAAAAAGVGNAGAGAAGAGGGGCQIPFTSLPNPNPAFGPNPSGAHTQPNPGSLPTTLPSMAHTPSQPVTTPSLAHAGASAPRMGMTWEYTCSKCGHRWESSNSQAHLTGSCPKCGLQGRLRQPMNAGPSPAVPFPTVPNANDGNTTFRIPRGSVRVVVFVCTALFAGVAGLVRWLSTGYYDRSHLEEVEEDKYRPKRRRRSSDD